MAPEAAAARALVQRRGPARSRVHGQQWYGRRRADRRSRFDACVAAMRRRRPISIETKKPAADAFRAGEPNCLDDGIMPVFCPTCQTNEFAQAALGDQEAGR